MILLRRIFSPSIFFIIVILLGLLAVWHYFIDPQVEFTNSSNKDVWLFWNIYGVASENAIIHISPNDNAYFRPHGDASFNLFLSTKKIGTRCNEVDIDCFVLEGTYGLRYVFESHLGESKYIIKRQ